MSDRIDEIIALGHDSSVDGRARAVELSELMQQQQQAWEREQ